MQQINWDNFSLKAESKQKSFEDLCMFLCCRELGITKIEAYQNQPGIETEPFEINGKKYGFQAKFFENGFDWTQVKGSLEKALNLYSNLDEIFIYSNADKTFDSKKTKATDKRTKAEKDLEVLATKKKVVLNYVTNTAIQLKLSHPSNFDLAQLFFGLGDEFGFINNSTHPEILTFLQSSEYLELPFVDKNKNTVNDVVGKILSSTQKVFLIRGHPGSGKSIFMHKLLQVFGGLNKETEAEMLKVLTDNNAVPILVNLKDCATDSLENILRGRKDDCKVNNKELGFIYIFDGLDELTPENADYVLSQIYDRNNKNDTKKIIISCRSGNSNKLTAKKYFNEITEYQIANLKETFIDKYFESKEDESKSQNLEKLKKSNSTLIKDIKDIFLIKLLWDTIEELNESSTSIELFSKKIDLLLENPKHRKSIEELNLPNPKKEQIIRLNQDISYEFQKEFQFRFPQKQLQDLILKRFERLDYKSADLILNYIADLFFENSYSDNQETSTTFIYQHRRYQEFFFAQKLKSEYEKNPKILREFNVISNRDFFKELFLKYLRKEYEKENNLAGLLELNLIDVYLGDYKGFGADEPYYLESDEFIPTLICQNEAVFNELLEDENLGLKDKISINFNDVENQFDLWNKDKQEYYTTEYLKSIWGRISFLIKNIAPFWKFGKIDIANELKKRADETKEIFERYKFSDNLRGNEHLDNPHWEKFESWVYFRILINGETVKDVFENLIRRNYKNFSDDDDFSFEEVGKEKLVKSFFRVCLREKKEVFFELIDSFDEYEFLALLDTLKSIEFLPLFIQTKNIHKKIKSFIQKFSEQITDKNSFVLFYKTFFKISLSETERIFAESEIGKFREKRDIDWRISKDLYHKYSLITFAFGNYSFDNFLTKKEGYSINYFNEQIFYAALFKDFVSLLNNEKSLEAIVRDYFRYINTYTEKQDRNFPSKEISILWANIIVASKETDEIKVLMQSRLVAEKQTFNPYSYYVELNRINKDLFNKIVNESELELFENHLKNWSDDFPSYVERCFILAQWFSELNPEKAKFYVIKGINDGLLRHNWRKDTIVCYHLVEALEILWKNNWLPNEILKKFTSKVFELAFRAYKITDGKYTWKGPNNVIEFVLSYDIKFAEKLWKKSLKMMEGDYFQNSLVTKILIAKVKNGLSLEKIKKGMYEFRYDYYTHQGKPHLDFYLDKFAVYLEIAECDLYTVDEKKGAFDWLYEQTNLVVERKLNHLNVSEIEKLRFERLCKKHKKKFKLSFDVKEVDKYKRENYDNFIEEIRKAKSQHQILEIYAKLQTFTLSEPEHWKLLIKKTFEVCNNIQAFTDCMNANYFPHSNYFSTNAKYFHFGLAATLENIDTRQEAIKYLSKNTGHGAFLNVIKAYEINKDKKMCLLLFERYLKFCDFLVN